MCDVALMFAGCCLSGRQTGETLSWLDICWLGEDESSAAAAMADAAAAAAAEKVVKRGPLGALLGLS